MYRRKKTGGGVLVATLCHPTGSTFIHKTKFSVLVKYVLVKNVSQAHKVCFAVQNRSLDLRLRWVGKSSKCCSRGCDSMTNVS